MTSIFIFFRREDIFLRFGMISLMNLLGFLFFLYFFGLHCREYDISGLNICFIFFKFFGSADKIVEHSVVVR